MSRPGTANCTSITETSLKWNTTGTGAVADYYGSNYAQFICVPDSGIVTGLTPVI